MQRKFGSDSDNRVHPAPCTPADRSVSPAHNQRHRCSYTGWQTRCVLTCTDLPGQATSRLCPPCHGRTLGKLDAPTRRDHPSAHEPEVNAKPQAATLRSGVGSQIGSETNPPPAHLPRSCSSEPTTQISYRNSLPHNSLWQTSLPPTPKKLSKRLLPAPERRTYIVAPVGCHICAIRMPFPGRCPGLAYRAPLEWLIPRRRRTDDKHCQRKFHARGCAGGG